MRTRKEIEEQLDRYDFTIWSISGNRIQAMQYNSGINVLVTIDEEENFELVYNVPRSIAHVKIGTCSPFSNEKHFEKQLKSMISIVEDLSCREQ